MQQIKSPLTGHMIRAGTDAARDVWWLDDICGRWGITGEAYLEHQESSITGGRSHLRGERVPERDAVAMYALARSEVWRHRLYRQKPPLFMSSAWSRTEHKPDYEGPVLTFTDMLAQARALTVQVKARRTLENLIQAEEEVGSGVVVPYMFDDVYPGAVSWRSVEPPAETGLAYACAGLEAAVIYRLLESEGLVHLGASPGRERSSTVHIMPQGYALQGSPSTGTTTGFVVCRFTDELDSLYEQVFDPLSEEMKIPIQRIKDIHHVDRIDDRILEEIDRSTFVVVDLTDDNFNTAFEAGYALALGKPIVWTMKKSQEGINLPFDIHAYNCLDWSPDDLDTFRAQVKFRILAAIKKSERG